MLPCSHLGEASITGDQEQKEDTGDYQGPEEERDRVFAALTVSGATAACRATEMYLMPLNCVLSNNENGELYGTCISLQSLKHSSRCGAGTARPELETESAEVAFCLRPLWKSVQA